MAKSTPGLLELMDEVYEKLKPKSYNFDQHSKPIKVDTLQEFTNKVVDQYLHKHNLDSLTLTGLDKLHFKN